MERAKAAGPARRVLVEYHPRLPDLFMAGGDELQLYEIRRHATTDLLDGSPIPHATSRVYHRLKAVPVQQLTCMQAYPHEQSPFLMAAGTLHGRVQIINFKLPPTGSAEPVFHHRNGSGGATRATEGLAEARSGVVQTFYPKANRQCTAVAWNPHSPSQIAVGLEKGRSDLSIHIYDLHSHESERIAPGGLYGSGRGLEGQYLPIKPLLSFVPNEGVTALAWKTNVPHLLVYGTAARWLRVHDLRGNGPQTVISITAHTKAVQGLALDPWNADVVATYSDNPVEPIKIWDLRKADPSEPLVSIKLPPSKRMVAGVAWSPVRMGVLAVTHADDAAIGLYDIREASSGQVLSSPSHTCLASGAVMSMSWQSRTATQREAMTNQASWEEVIDRAVPNRVLVATRQGFEELSMHDYRSLHVSRTGELLLGCGRILLDYSLATHVRNDTAVVMMERIRAGYSMDVGRNLQVMADELDAHPHEPELQRLIRVWSWVDRVEDCCSTAEQQLQQQPADGPSPAADWPIAGLGEAGVLDVFERVMAGQQEAEAESSSIHDVLGCAVYSSRGRRVALKACGWSCGEEGEMAASAIDDTAGGAAVAGDMSRPVLARIMEECEALSHYERSAALAVFHGDLRAAVQALRRGAEALLSARAHEVDEMEMMEAKFGRSVDALSVAGGEAAAESASYAELLQLVAMCVAGYVPPSSGAGRRGASGLWRDMCQALLDRPALQARTSVSYLRAACSFLASNWEQASPTSYTTSPDRSSSSIASGPPTLARRTSAATPTTSATTTLADLPYRRVLFDPSISLADRTALACQYLPWRQLQAFLRHQGALCMEEGNLEGLQLFGLGPHGIQLLQAYIDRTGDVQTAALLVSRVIVPPDATVVQEWIETYRDWLNGARLWHERAVMDVGRAQLLSELYKRQAASTGAASQQSSRGERPEGPSPPPAAPPGLPSVPPQLFVRCHYCSTAIQLNSLRRQGRMGQSWLSRQKPLLNCCPECRKPLPRCYICLLPLGCLNPYLELKRLMQLHPSSMHAPADNRDAAAAASDALDHDSMASLGGLRFPEWFTWCQNCKHGGHAHHILDWFETHDECGVSGCSCKCYAQDSALLSSAPQTAELATATTGAAPAGQGGGIPSPPLTTASLAPFTGSAGKGAGGRLWDR